MWRDTYVICLDINNYTLLASAATPENDGKDISYLQDADGKHFIVAYVDLARTQGHGWTSFMFPKLGETTAFPEDHVCLCSPW